MADKTSINADILDKGDVGGIVSVVEAAIKKINPRRDKDSIEINITKAELVDDSFYEELLSVCQEVYSVSYLKAALTITLKFNRRSDAWTEYRQKRIQYFKSIGI